MALGFTLNAALQKFLIYDVRYITVLENQAVCGI